MTIKFNGESLPTWVTVTGISFQTLPDIDVMKYKTPRSVGEIDGGVKRGSSTINLKVMIEKDKVKNIHQQKDELKMWAMGDNWKPSRLVFDEEPDKYYVGRVSNSMTIDDLFTHGKTNIEFYCADPLKYSVKETVKLGKSGWVEVENKGIEKVPTVIDIEITNSNIGNFNILNNVTNKKINIRGNFKIGQIITIDSGKKKILLNGEPAMKLMTFDSDWLYLTQGIQRFFFATEPRGGVSSIQVTHRQVD